MFCSGDRGLFVSCFLGFLFRSLTVGGRVFPPREVFFLSGCWIGVRLSPPLPATSAFNRSIITSMLALFVAVIAVICLSCCSCSIVNNIACNSPSSSAAAVSWVRSAASLKWYCFAVVAEYCFRSSHLLVKYVWSAAHVCCAAVLFSHATIWSSVNISLFHIICAHRFLLFTCCDSGVAQ